MSIFDGGPYYKSNDFDTFIAFNRDKFVLSNT